MKTTSVIAITGTRGVGKDTLVALLQRLHYGTARFAFADQLRKDLEQFVTAYFEQDVWTTDPEIKERLRPLLIGYGMAQRSFDPEYWADRTIAAIKLDRIAYPDMLACIADCRFENEAIRLREAFGASFILINLTREGSPPPTDEEEKHFRQVAAMADYHLHWGGDTAEQQLEHARRVLEWVGLS